MSYLNGIETVNVTHVSYDYETEYSQAYILQLNVNYNCSDTKYSQLCE